MSNLKKQRSFLQRLIDFFKPKDMDAALSATLSVNKKPELTGQDIICLSTQDWNDLWTRKQRFMLQFARQGNKVLYVETQFHWVTYFRLLRKQWRRAYLFLFEPRQIEKNLYVFTPPILLPGFQIFYWISHINNFFLAIALKIVMTRLNIKNPLLWLYCHYNQPLIKKLKCKKALYECVDDYPAAKGLIKPEVAKKLETATLSSVDVTVVTAESLTSSRSRLCQNIHVVSNAANVSHFNRTTRETGEQPIDLSAIPSSRLVFLGAIAYWVDLNLLRYLAAFNRQWQIVLIGPVITDVADLTDIRNIHFLGRKSYDKLPSYLAWCDVALNPYKVDDVAKGCSPLKIYEYLAAGLPVVSTEMPEARKFGELIYVSSDYKQFAQNVAHILSRDAKTRMRDASLARKESRKHSWESRFTEVEKIALGVLR